MSNKQTIIQAIQEMDIQKLEELLEDDRPYMDVSKSLFLNKLKELFDERRENEISSFNDIVPGICARCNKGCKGYSFITKDNHVLDLFFEGVDGEVTDIYLCNELETDKQLSPKYQMYFSFYKDEKVAFKPSVDFLIKKQKIEEASAEFDEFKNRLVWLEEFGYWKTKYHEVIKSLDFPYIFTQDTYLAFEPFRETCNEIRDLIDHLEKRQFAINALSELKEVESEKELVYWLLTYKKSYLSDYGFVRLDGWEQSGLITLEKYPLMIIDCSEYIESLQFSFLYNKHHDELLKKYDPTSEQIKQYGGSVTYSLTSFLRLHGKYLDILPELK